MFCLFLFFSFFSSSLSLSFFFFNPHPQIYLERNISVREKHRLVASHTYPDGDQTCDVVVQEMKLQLIAPPDQGRLLPFFT